MSDLIAIVYPDEATALDVRSTLLELQGEYLIELSDVVVVTKDAAGKVKLHQVTHPVAGGALMGGLWGSLIGLLFLNPLLGLAVGAAAGAFSGSMADYGIEDDYMREVAESFAPGSAAVFVLVKEVTADKVLPAIAPYGGTVLKTSLPLERETELREALRAHLGENESAPRSDPS
jgi:uncharacterized membrane protein